MMLMFVHQKSQLSLLFLIVVVVLLSPPKGVTSFTATTTTLRTTTTTTTIIPKTNHHHHQFFSTFLRESASSLRKDDNDNGSDDTNNEALMNIARKLKLQVLDLDDGVFGFGSNDYHYGLEVVRTLVKIKPTLGLELTEMASGVADGRGLVLVSGVHGNAATCQPAVHVGDALTGVIVGDHHAWNERTTGLNYDLTVEAIGRAKEEAEKQGIDEISLELNRLVPRARIQVQVETGDNSVPVQTLEGLAGENLRQLLIRKGVKVYDRNTKRFDMPYATGDCAGEGICGTCLVAVLEDENDILSPRDGIEHLITKKRPLNWRASCRAIVGFNNVGGMVRIQTCPQSALQDELNPGVKSVSMEE